MRLKNKIYDQKNIHTLLIKNNRLSSNGSLTEPRRKILFFPICHSVEGRPSDCIRILWRKSKGNYLSTNHYIFLSSFMTGLVEHKGDSREFSTCNYFWQIQIEVRSWKFSTIGWKVWQYKLWSFQMGGTRLEIFLPKNQHTQRKVSNFENWSNGEVSKCAKSWLSKSIF